MELIEYLSDPVRRDALIASLGINSDYLWQIANSWKGRKPGPKLAQKIDAITGGLVSKESLRPDIWPTQPAKVA